MPSIRQSIRSSTASKRPTSAIADGQIALNTASGTPGMFFKDSAGNIIKAGPAHYGASAPNSSPAVGGSTGNSIGEAWLDSSLTPAGWKIWNGSAFVNATPLSSDTVQGLVELATNAETQAGVDTARAVTSASLQSKVSDSISTASASGIASSTAVKTAYDLANAALPKSGGIITGNLEIGSTGSFTFEGSTADGFETTLAVVDPTLDRTITFPNITGTVVTTGDTGTVTSTMILDGTILNADVNASAAIAGTKISPDFGSQNTTTTGTSTAASFIPTSSSVPTNGVYLPAANSVAISTNGTGRLFVDSAGKVGIGGASVAGLLQLKYATDVHTSFRNATAGGLSAGTLIESVNDAFNSYNPIYLKGSQFTFGTDSAGSFVERLRLTSTGALNFVGAGTAGSTQAVSFNGSAPVNSLVIDSSGNVGVGAAASANGVLRLNVSSGNNANLVFSENSTDRYLLGQVTGDNALRVYDLVAASERLRITSGGLVGIGTSAPQSQLQVLDQIRVSNSAQSQGSIVLGDGSSTAFNVGIARWNGTTNAAGAGGIGYFSQGAGNVGGHYFYTGDAAAGSQTARMIVNPSGNVGIGIVSPQVNLHLKDNTNPRLRFEQDNSSVQQQIESSAGNFIFTSDVNNVASGGVIFKDGVDERARIDGSGKLLVGTSTARSNFYNGTNDAAQVQLEGTDYKTGSFSLTCNSTNVAQRSILSLNKSSGSAVGSNTLVGSTDYLGEISFQGNDGTNFVEGARIRAEVDGTPGADDMPSRLVFSTTADGAASPTERMRITNGGLLLINTITALSAAGRINILYTSSVESGISIQSSVDSFNTAISFLNTSGTQVGYISTGASSTTYNTSSDYRLKENVTPVPNGITRLLQLKPSRFNFIADPDHTVDGFIAHEAQAVVPECVTGEKDAVDEDGNPRYQGIDQSKLVPLLTAALQEAIARIETLETRLSALEGA